MTDHPRRGPPPAFDLGFGINVPDGPTLEQAAEVARTVAGKLSADVAYHVRKLALEPNTLTLWEVACLERLAKMAAAVAPCEQQVKETIKRARRKTTAAEADAGAYARRPAA